MQIFSSDRCQSAVTIKVSHPGMVSGSIRGPYCRYSRTLSSSFPFDSEGRARVVDPCYWTPSLPFQYRVKIAGQNDAETREFDWGIRCCEPHANDLRVVEKRFVVRAISRLQDCDLATLRELPAALVVRNPEDALCREATETGVLIIADLRTTDDAIGSVRRLDQFAAVQFAIVPNEFTPLADSDILTVGWGEKSGQDISILDEHQISTGPPPGKPVFVSTQSLAPSALERRQACDRLQRTAAAHGQFAGYLVLDEGFEN